MKLFQHEERFHPCCGFNLQSVVPRLVPALQLAMMKLGLIILIHGIFQNWDSLQNDKTTKSPHYYLRLVCWSGYGLYILVNYGLLMLLWRGCKSRRPGLIRVWLISNPISVLFVVAIMMLNIIMRFRWDTGVSSPEVFVLAVGYSFLQCYISYVVYFFVKEMEDDIFMTSAMRGLTDAEVAEFETGLTPPFSINDLDSKTKSLLDRIQYQCYKKEDFEIDVDKLHLDLNNPLGSGDYGKVYKGQLLATSTGKYSAVAVKTVDSENTDVVCFKALLTELKVMTYLGTHPNLVKLLGASTTGIKDRKLLIVSEFCALGNLHLFLIGCRGLFRNLVNDRVQIESYNTDNTIISSVEHISTLDLVRWSQEIASGMEYLGFMRVIHGDLAARNVLLTEQKLIKLTDFGLSRQLYNYSVYVKKQNTPLPWRWLALESLKDMSFSTCSDVWSYAITLYEMFTLGEIPFPGHQFCLEFVHDLKNGLRPSRPPFAPQEIWTLMEQCWKADPKDRPKFGDIVKLLETLRHK